MNKQIFQYRKITVIKKEMPEVKLPTSSLLQKSFELFY